MTFEKVMRIPVTRCWVLILIVLGISVKTTFAKDDKTITWIKNNAPPFYITEGELKGKAFGDLTQKMIMEQMKNYTHKIENMPLARMNRSWLKRIPLCFSTMIFKSMPDHCVTSIPNLVYYPHGIITLKSKIAKFGNQKTVSLDLLLKTKKLVFLKAAERSYAGLDKIIKKYQDSPKVQVRNGNESTGGVMKMLLWGRYDYTIEYPYTYKYFIRNKAYQDKFEFLSIQEAEGTVVLGAVGCTNSDWGRKVIKDMNQAILKVRNSSEYKKILQDWLVPQGAEDKYWKLYKDKVLTISR